MHLKQDKVKMDPWIYFLMKTNEYKIMIKSTKNDLVKTYFLIYPIINTGEI